VIVTRTDAKAGAPICSLECLGKWQMRLKQPLLLGIGSEKNRHCSHCSVCATAIRIPEDCALHGTYCPSSFWEGTVSASEAVGELVRLKSGPIRESEFAYLLLLLEEYPESSPHDIALEVVESIEDSRSDDTQRDGAD